MQTYNSGTEEWPTSTPLCSPVPCSYSGYVSLAQTGLAEKAKAMGVSLPSGAAGSTPADPAAEKAAVAAAAPGIVKVWGQ